MEKRKTVAVGNGGTIIEVRAYVRGTRLDATGPYGNECVGMNEWKSTDTDGARENLKLKPNRNRYRVTSPGITPERRFRGRNTLDSARTVIR